MSLPNSFVLVASAELEYISTTEEKDGNNINMITSVLGELINQGHYYLSLIFSLTQDTTEAIQVEILLRVVELRVEKLR